MPLKPYERDGVFWARGRVELNGRPVTPYIRRSTGASSEAGARDWIRAEEERAIRRHLLGAEAGLTFDEAIVLYQAKPDEAKYLLRILPHLIGRPVPSITPREVRELGPKLYPTCSTDTWRRQVIVPVSAVINNAHELGKGPPIRIKGYTTKERVEQDVRRGKVSRQPRQAGSVEWLRAFMAAADPYNAALAFFMFATGARIGQAVEVDPRRDLDLTGARVRLIAQKGHPEQWVAIPHQLVVMLANLPPKRPHDRKGDRRLPPRVFGYASSTGMHATWRRICDAAGIPYLSPHEAGRHGFYTELRVRQGLDPVTVAKAGRWADHTLPERVYAHAIETASEADLRALIGTKLVQEVTDKSRNLLSGKRRIGR